MTGDVELNIVQIITTEDVHFLRTGISLDMAEYSLKFTLPVIRSSILYIYICVPN